MPHVLQRPQAREDLLEIWEHIAGRSVYQADAWVDRLDRALELLASQPRMGRERTELGYELRSFPFGAYVVFHQVIEGGIEIVRVLHASRDLQSSWERKVHESV